MSKINVIKNAFIVSTIILLISCKKENSDTSLTKQVGKVETIYKEGSIKNESYDDNYVKSAHESVMGQEYKDSIRLAIEKTYSKTSLKNGGNPVGVFKSGSCGSFPVLDILMDNEDSNNASWVSGWNGSSYLDSKKNVHLLFCVVSGAYFDRTTDKEYGVLRLSGNLPYATSMVRRYFDNEDDNNINSATVNGSPISGTYGFCSFGGNDLLSFYYYPKASYSSIFPNLGISYGVLGTFGSSKGAIHTDDEDSPNGDWCYLDLWVDNKYIYQSGYQNNMPGLLDVGTNTTLYISKVQ